MDYQERQTKRTIVLGAPGTGKTFLLHKILALAGQRTLVITPYDNEWDEKDANGMELYPELPDLRKRNCFFTGIRRHVYVPKYTISKLKNFEKGILVLDDCRAYLDPKLNPEFHTLLLGTRQHMIDVFAVAHGFRELPPAFLTFATDYFLFRTEDNLAKRKADIRNFHLVEKMQAKVNKTAIYNPYHYEWFKV